MLSLQNYVLYETEDFITSNDAILLHLFSGRENH